MSSTRYPVMLDLAGRNCLVVGGGAVAARKVRRLSGCDAIVTVIAPDLCEDLSIAVSSELVIWSDERYSAIPDLAHGEKWAFVVAATDHSPTNQRVVTEAERLGIWANNASARNGGAASLPAYRTAGQIGVAVSTNGVHPGAALWLAELLEKQVPAGLVELLDLLVELRDGDELDQMARADWSRVLDSGTLELVREGQIVEAKERLEACLL